jgi:hypothetical protein
MRPLIVANCSGFYGDRMSAAREMVEDGPIDVLSGDWLAELTMLILAKAARKNPDRGYAVTFVKQMEDVLATCLERNIRVVANAGGLNPRGCAEAVAKVAEGLGLKPKIAYVTGDNLLPQLSDLAAPESDGFRVMRGSPALDLERVVSANAYLGGWAVADALSAGADVVITGRTTDAALVCGPAAWWHEWERDDWDALAGAVVAGHVIECGAHATGGNYSFFTEIENMRHVGFPWAEIAADGSAVIGKHAGTGGEVSIGTVTSQILYEIASPRYFGPDVTTRFDTIELDELHTDRVRIHGVRGEPPTGWLKVSINMIGGFRNDLRIGICGLDVDAKAELLEAAFWDSCPYDRNAYDEVSIRLARSDQPDAQTNEQATAAWEITLKDTDKDKVGRAAANAAVELALASTPGFYLLSGPPGPGREFGVHASALVVADAVDQRIHLVGEALRRGLVADVEASAHPEAWPASEDHNDPRSEPNGQATAPAPLGTIIGARSGDKGGDANIGLFARSDEAWRWLDAYLTIDRLRELLPEVRGLEAERYRLPLIWSLNFVIHGILGEGVAASVRQDGQAKSLGEWLRSRVVDIPVALLPAAAVGEPASVTAR